MRTRSLCLIILGLGIWCAAAWTNLFLFTRPWLDTWCYLAPAAASPCALHLRTPLLGGFLGGDHTWGLHFPGAPLLYSCWFALVAFRPAGAVVMFMALWLGLAAGVGWLSYQVTQKAFWAMTAAAAVLSEHSLFICIQGQRPELVGSIILLIAWVSLADVHPFRSRIRLVALAGSFYLLPLTHPVTLLAGGIVCTLLGGKTWLEEEKQGRWRPFILSCLGYAGGIITLFLWFYCQPDAWSQFHDHAVSNEVSYSYGFTFWRALQGFYYPTLTGHLLWGASLLVAMAALVSWSRRRSRANQVIVWGAVIEITCLAADQQFYNVLYLGLSIPEAVILGLFLLFWLGRRGVDERSGRWVRASAAVLIAAHGLFWVTRTGRYLKSGRPDIRAELMGIAASLPRQRHILIPESLWEAALQNDPGRFAMNTLPQMSSVRMRTYYEAYIYGKLSKGDLVITDRFQSHQPIRSLGGDGWERVTEYKHILSGQSDWGYDLVLWRKN